MYSESQLLVPTGAEVSAPLLSLVHSMRIRRAETRDVFGLHQLECSCFDPGMAFNRRQIQTLVRNPRADFWVLTCAGEIIAQLIVLRRRQGRALHGRIYSLTVAPRYRGQGLARQLLALGMEQLRTAAVKRVYLEVEASAIAPLKLYTSLGFKQEKTLPAYYGEGRDGIKMGLKLDV